MARTFSLSVCVSVTVSFSQYSPRYLSPSNLTIFKKTLSLLSLPLSPGQKPHPGPLPPPPFFPQNKSTVGSSNLDTKQILHSPESRKQTQRPGKGRKKNALAIAGRGGETRSRKKENDIIPEREREKTPARTEGCEKTDQKR